MLTFNFTPFPVLASDRLVFRHLDENDANEIFQLRSDKETMKYIPRPLVTNKEQALEHIRMIEEKIQDNTGINWAISLKGSPKMIGIIGFYRLKPENFRAEIGYMLLPEFSGKGIITESISRLIDYGFNEMRLHSIEAVIDPENIASAKVLEKNNFIKEAHFKENEFFEGKFLDSVIYSILNKK